MTALNDAERNAAAAGDHGPDEEGAVTGPEFAFDAATPPRRWWWLFIAAAGRG